MKSIDKQMLQTQPLCKKFNFIDKLVESLASSLMEKVTDSASGWILNIVGIDTEGDELKNIKAELSKQTELIESVKTEINQVEAQINGAVVSITNEIEKAIDKIEDQNLLKEYNTLVNIINIEVSKIQGLMERLKIQSTCDPDSKNKKDLKLLSNNIQSDVYSALAAINNSLMGKAGAEGLLSIWARLSIKHSDSPSDYASRLYQQFMYYYSIQANALQLIIEAYHSSQPPEINKAKITYIDWKQNIDAQLAEYNRNAMRTSISNELNINGAVLDVAVTDDHVFVLSSNCLYSFKTSDWSLEKSFNYDFVKYRWLSISGNYLMVIGTPKLFSLDILKINIKDGFVIEDPIFSEPKKPTVIVPIKGLGSDEKNLYLLSISKINDNTVGAAENYIHVLDVANMTLIHEKRFDILEGDSDSGDLLVVDSIAYYQTSAHSQTPYGNFLNITDLNRKTSIAKIPVPDESGTVGHEGGSPLSISDGLITFAFSNQNICFADIKDFKFLEIVSMGMNVNSLYTEGNLTYFSSGLRHSDPGGLFYIFRSQYQKTIWKSMDFDMKITKIIHVGDYLLLCSPPSESKGKISILGYANTIEIPPQPSI